MCCVGICNSLGPLLIAQRNLRQEDFRKDHRELGNIVACGGGFRIIQNGSGGNLVPVGGVIGQSGQLKAVGTAAGQL